MRSLGVFATAVLAFAQAAQDAAAPVVPDGAAGALPPLPAGGPLPNLPPLFPGGAAAFGAPRLASAQLPLAPSPLARFAPVAGPVVPPPVRPIPRAPLCPPAPVKPRGRQCMAVRNPAGCVVAFDCMPEVPKAPVVCPQAPERPAPDSAPNCNWIAVLDKDNCILEYECEPKAPARCEDPPLAPDDSARCKWVPMRDANGCVTHFECTPPGPWALPQVAPLYPLARPALPVQPLVRPVVAAAAPQLLAAAPTAQLSFNSLLAHCGEWAAAGECQINPRWMLPNCRAACLRLRK